MFLSSLAVDIGELGGGIVLSGGDADGTLGIKAIKERDGITFAQTSNGYGPQHPNMPDAAIASGLVDFAIPVEEMGAKLVAFVRGAAQLDAMVAGTDEDETVDAAVPEI